jgi:hypothetical protein
MTILFCIALVAIVILARSKVKSRDMIEAQHEEISRIRQAVLDKGLGLGMPLEEIEAIIYPEGDRHFARNNGLKDRCKKCDACGLMVLNPCGSERSDSCDQPVREVK